MDKETYCHPHLSWHTFGTPLILFRKIHGLNKYGLEIRMGIFCAELFVDIIGLTIGI